jgi:hypothetical protein|uniref:Uncharacterized protein n=1 Tax=Chelativorans sp. (strain BNC1) TaxID=266779 RepID=Q11MV5_CHESB
MLGHLIGEMRILWSSVTAWACDRQHRMDTSREIQALDAHERARVLGELGLTQTELGAGLQIPFISRDLISGALHALVIDPDALRARHGSWERDMRRVCMACPARGRCRRDLATGDFARRYRHYCPNAASLVELEHVGRGNGRTSVR